MLATARIGPVWFWLLSLVAASCMLAQTTNPPRAQTPRSIVVIKGDVELSLAKEPTRWISLKLKSTNLLSGGDRLKTPPGAPATVRWSGGSPCQLKGGSVFAIPPDDEPRTLFNLLRGSVYFFHRDKPGTHPVRTPAYWAIVRGTEFHIEVREDETSTLTLLDGFVEVTNELGAFELKSGEIATAAPGAKPQRTAVINANNVIQWCLYYPAILDVDELRWTDEGRNALSESIAVYRAGDLLDALAKMPAAHQPGSDAERIYVAELFLAVGKVEDAEQLLNQRAANDENARRLAAALRKLIAAVKFMAPPETSFSLPTLATEWLAESYYRQSQHDLSAARAAARKAVAVSPQFSFGWSRVAELEFGFGRTDEALHAVEQSLKLAPRNPEALALKGYLMAARNEISSAIAQFDQAIAIDGALGNAWLGRGLCRIRRGDLKTGLSDLETAAVLEPQRALLRSYLGKAWSDAGDSGHATNELAIAQRLDPNDPTSWLYSALLKYRENRVNEAIQDVQRSQELNKNRALYRSQFLLDQDRAVRSVNLAQFYHDAGLTDVSLWEASRAVNADYANFSAHLFLADSFQRLRDLRTVNQRYETPAVNEYLVATLLAPVGAGTLAHSVSQQEYSKLFERDGFGVASSTEYLSRGAWIQSGAQYGTFGDTSYAVSAFYQSDPGQQRNNDIEQTELSVQLQQQITPKDTIYFRAIFGDAEGGDLAQYYNARTEPNTGLRFDETQRPILLAGYHREWAPGVHTLALAGRLADTLHVDDPQQITLAFQRSTNGAIADAVPITIAQRYRNEVEIYTAELQQILQFNPHTLIGGVRYQNGEFKTENLHRFAAVQTSFGFVPVSVPPLQAASADFSRLSVYGYEHWQPFDSLLLIAGVSYDHLKYPQNFRFAPISNGEKTSERVSPKAGLIWTPAKHTTIRAAYSQSLGGVAFDQSFRLEPVQIAGFNQAFRSLIPESVAGVNSAARFETWNLSFEQKIGGGTFLGIGGEVLSSRAERVLGTYDLTDVAAPLTRSSTREHLDFEERSLLFSASQLVGREWSFGVRYRLRQAELEDRFVDVPNPTPSGFVPRQNLDALLHELTLFAIFNHRSGFFAEAQTTWHAQHSDGYSPALADEDLWQIHLFGGYRFAQRRAELRIGVLNVTDQNYRLNPLNLISELPRERTFVTSLRFYF